MFLARSWIYDMHSVLCVCLLWSWFMGNWADVCKSVWRITGDCMWFEMRLLLQEKPYVFGFSKSMQWGGGKQICRAVLFVSVKWSPHIGWFHYWYLVEQEYLTCLSPIVYGGFLWKRLWSKISWSKLLPVWWYRHPGWILVDVIFVLQKAIFEQQTNFSSM